MENVAALGWRLRRAASRRHVAADHLAQTEHLNPRERLKVLMSGGIALAKVKALAVAEYVPVATTSAAHLFTRCTQMYLQCRATADATDHNSHS